MTMTLKGDCYVYQNVQFIIWNMTDVLRVFTFAQLLAHRMYCYAANCYVRQGRYVMPGVCLSVLCLFIR